jgi:hypothetical protein
MMTAPLSLFGFHRDLPAAITDLIYRHQKTWMLGLSSGSSQVRKK